MHRLNKRFITINSAQRHCLQLFPLAFLWGSVLSFVQPSYSDLTLRNDSVKGRKRAQHSNKNSRVVPFRSGLVPCLLLNQSLSPGKCNMLPEVKSLSRVRLFAIPWTVVYQASLSMEFSRQEYWSGLPFPSPGGSSWPRDRTQVSCIAGRRFTLCFLDWAKSQNSFLEMSVN